MEQNRNEIVEKYQAMEHDMSDAVDAKSDPVEGHKVIEHDVVNTYKAIEEGVVGTYKKVETGVVNAYKKVEDKFVETFFTKPGESVEDAKKRLKGENS